MAMPWQLAEGLRRRPKGRPRRLIVEQLPSINVKTLSIPSPYDYKTYILPNISFRLPHLASAKVSFQTVEFHFPSLHRGQIGPIQTFNLKHIRVGFGIRHTFICGCGRPVLKLYYKRNLRSELSIVLTVYSPCGWYQAMRFCGIRNQSLDGTLRPFPKGNRRNVPRSRPRNQVRPCVLCMARSGGGDPDHLLAVWQHPDADKAFCLRLL